MAYKWNKFSSAYKQSKDKKDFYKEKAGNIVRKEADKISGTKSFREKLGLLNKEKLQRAKKFEWDHSKKSAFLSDVFADFAKQSGSEKPEFDAMLILERIMELDPSFDPDNPRGVAVVIEKGKITLSKNGRELIANKELIKEEALAVAAEGDKAEAKDESAAKREALAQEVEPPPVKVVPPGPEPEPGPTQVLPTPSPDFVPPVLAEVAPPTPAELEPGPPEDMDEAIEVIEYRETVEWNEEIIPSYDDGIVVDASGRVDDVTLDIMRASYERGVNNIEFYWIGVNFLKPEVKKKMGVQEKYGVPRSGKVKPGHWMEWVDANKPEGMDRAEYIRSLINPEVIKLCQQIKATKHSDQSLSDLIGYHGMTHEVPTRGRHLIDISEQEIAADIEFFQELMRVAFDEPTYMVSKGRAPYGAGMTFEVPDAARKYSRHATKLQAGAERVNPDFQWNSWHVDTVDWDTKGRFNTEATARKAVDLAYGDDLKTPKYVLMHEEYYAGATSERIDNLYDSIDEMTVSADNGDLSRFEKYPQKEVVGVPYYQLHAKGVAVRDVVAVYLNGDSRSGRTREVSKGSTLFVLGVTTDRKEVLLRGQYKNANANTIYYARVPIESVQIGTLPDEIAPPTRAELIERKDKYGVKLTTAAKREVAGALGEKMDAGEILPEEGEYLVYISKKDQRIYLVQYTAGKFDVIRASKVSTGRNYVDNTGHRYYDTPTQVFNREDTTWRVTDMSVPDFLTTPIPNFNMKEYESEYGLERAWGVPSASNPTPSTGYGVPGGRKFPLGAVSRIDPATGRVMLQNGRPIYTMIVLHPTSNPAALGKKASHGCIRASNDFLDILDEYGILDQYGKYVVVGGEKEAIASL